METPMKNSIRTRPFSGAMGQAVAERTVLRKLDPDSGEVVPHDALEAGAAFRWETWAEVAHRVALGNVLVDPTKDHGDYDKQEFEFLRDAIAQGKTLMSGRHLQHGDASQPERNMEVFTNCATAANTFSLFYLLLNGSGVGRCYDDDMMLVNWDNAPSVICVLDSDHADFDYSAHTSVRDAKHMYGEGRGTFWFEVPDTREGWAEAVEVWENAAFQKIHKDKLLILNFSKVRPRKAPIKGMQNRPSSGPVPLMNAFAKAARLKGAGLDRWLQAMHMDHYFAECVLVGGARRAARMSEKYWKDRTVLDFIMVKRPIEYAGRSLKQVVEYRKAIGDDGGLPPEAFLWSSNDSVGVDEEFWGYVHMKRTHPDFTKDDAVWARKVYKTVMECAYGDGTGEPGLINLHMLNKEPESFKKLAKNGYIGGFKYKVQEETELYVHRIAKRAQAKKHFMIVNPSLRAGTRVVTKDGAIPIEKLEGKQFQVFTRNGEYAEAECWLSGKDKPLYRVTLEGGFGHYATAEHKWPVITEHGDVRTATTDLIPGDLLPVAQVRSLRQGGIGDRSEGFLIGWNLGDGWISKSSLDGEGLYGFIVAEGKEGAKQKLAATLKDAWHTGEFGGKEEISTSCQGVRDLFHKFGVTHKKDGLPSAVFEEASDEFRAGLIDGLFSSDGHMSARGSDLGFTSSHKRLIDSIAELLGLYGIPSRVYRATRVNGEDFEAYELRIGKKEALEHFYGVFGDLTYESTNATLKSLRAHGEHRIDRIRVVTVEEVGVRENVWDIRVDDPTHSFQIAHCVTGNCGEIPLSLLGGYCTIADVVPYHCGSVEEVVEVCKSVTRALIRVNTLGCLYQAEVKRTNRIGVGLTGVHEFAWKFFGLSFRDLIKDDEKAADFWMTLKSMAANVRKEAERYAKELGVVVPHTMFTIKPSGTVSKLFGLTEGWHLPSMKFYLRWVQFRNDDPLVDQYRAAGYPSRVLETYRGHTIVGFPTQPVLSDIMPEGVIVTAGEATPEEQFTWLQLGEKYWINGAGDDVGGQISFTLKYDPDRVTYQELRDMMKQYMPTIKCCSVMPQTDNAAYEYQPEEMVTKADFESISQAIKKAMTEDVDKVHVDCDSGACPVDFTK